VTFLESIFARLERSANSPVLGEVRGGQILEVTGGQLLAMVSEAREFLAARGLKRGDRCALFAPNSVRWVALDLALMAEGMVVVPLDPRQVPHEIAAVIKDSTPSLVCSCDPSLSANLSAAGAAASRVALFDDIFTGTARSAQSSAGHAHPHADHDAVTIVYTSGTSGEPKGVVLNAGNIAFMLGATHARLDQLMGVRQEPEKVFQYAPFCFAAARILLLTSLSRNSVLVLSTDLSKIADELKIATPNYFVNVPMFLERVRRKVEESIQKRGGFASKVFTRAQRAYQRKQGPGGHLSDRLWLSLANSLIFPAIRKNIGPNLKALICGSAPLSADTQLFFMMLGIPVLQVYGLTETTAICTMDEPGKVEPGRVGRAVPGVEMVAADNGEILVRGPHIFPGYWQKPAATAKALEGGWFHTGDQGEADASGNWRITGRLKNLIILNSGHNIAPEPIEQALAAGLPEAQQVVLVGNQRSYLAALVTTAGATGSSNGAGSAGGNGIDRGRIQSVMDTLNTGLPHYKQIRAFSVLTEPFSMENGLLTTMGKLKRDAISERFAAEIEQLYQKKPS
jgi:long-chain acyl-CoA synthetase